ncbi:MAG: AAA family ATPase [Deltaproteobacteria bacterium]|nr:MAG: AAA family ATPase [Deltaproteobacteria bacterium]
MSRSHEEALAHLAYAISQGDGFVTITGEVGTGKTTLCRVFLENLDDTTESAYIFNPKLNPKQLLMAIDEEFGLAFDANNTKELIDTLNSYLMERKAEGKKVVLLIDEAQNLAADVLELIRLLSNLETSKSKLLQIVLVGQPELGDILDSHELRQLGQRITLRCNLKPLTFKEVKEYIAHRIHIASKKPVAQFTQAAYRAIYKYSAGIPRLINIVCDRALLTAYVLNQKKITANITRTAIMELSGKSDFKRIGPLGWKKVSFVLSILCLALIILFIYRTEVADIKGIFTLAKIKTPELTEPAPSPPSDTSQASSPSLNLPDTLPESARQSVSVKPPAPVKQPVAVKQSSTAEYFSDFLKDMDVSSSRHLALKAVLKLWKSEAEIAQALNSLENDDAFFRLASEQNGLVVKRLGCNLDLIKSLNLPAVLAVSLPEWGSPGYLSIHKIDSQKITLQKAPNNEFIEIPPDLLKTYCSGAVYIPWKNFFAYKGTIPLTAPGESVIMLKMHLQDIGFNDIEINPIYDDLTKDAVKQIQKKNGIRPDGIVGPLTKIVLYNEKKSLNIPHLARQ